VVLQGSERQTHSGVMTDECMISQSRVHTIRHLLLTDLLLVAAAAAAAAAEDQLMRIRFTQTAVASSSSSNAGAGQQQESLGAAGQQRGSSSSSNGPLGLGTVITPFMTVADVLRRPFTREVAKEALRRELSGVALCLLLP